MEVEYRRLLANVVTYNRVDAWRPGSDAAEKLLKTRARVAWTELWMFPKACLYKMHYKNGRHHRK